MRTHGRSAVSSSVCVIIALLCHHAFISGEIVCAIVCVYAREAGTGQTPLCPSRRWQYLSSMQAGWQAEGQLSSRAGTHSTA